MKMGGKLEVFWYSRSAQWLGERKQPLKSPGVKCSAEHGQSQPELGYLGYQSQPSSDIKRRLLHPYCLLTELSEL